MSKIYDSRKKAETAVKQPEAAASEPSFDALRSGAAAPTAGHMGHRVDLPDAMREMMESAFGADLSAVRLYQSEAVRDAGVKAVAQGSDIAFAPGVLDFTSYGGQALLGHEISHVVSQARGEVTGSGLLNDPALEARADREGAMAAMGRQISAPTEALSPVTAAPAAGPMQCFGKKKTYEPYQKIDVGKVGQENNNTPLHKILEEDPARLRQTERKDMRGFADKLTARYSADKYDRGGLATLNNGQDVRAEGLSLSRMASTFGHSFGEGYSKREITKMYDNLMAPHRRDLDRTNPKAVAKAQASFDKGMAALKEMHYNRLKRMEATYGTLPSQMHTRDFVQLAGDRFNDHFRMGQDLQQLFDGAGRYFNMNDPKDQEMKALHDYYYAVSGQAGTYAPLEFAEEQAHAQVVSPDFLDQTFSAPQMQITPQMEAAIHGPSLDPNQQAEYIRGLHQRADNAGWTNRLYGRFKKPNNTARQQ